MQQAEGRFINDLNVPIDHLLVNSKDWIRYEGVPGYEQALAILADPAHPEHQELLTWIGPFEPNRFDLEAVNADLVESFGAKPKARAEKPSTPEAPAQT